MTTMSESGNELVDRCWNRQLEQLSSLLEDGHSADRSDHNGLTPLQICASLGWSEAVLKLLEHGADIHLASPLGWTALMQAVSNAHADTVRILLQAGARISDKNSLGWDVVSLAVTSKNENILAILTPMIKGFDLTRALAVACQQGSFTIVKYLINLGAHVDGKLPVSGLTPLMLAACGGHVDVVEALLSSGANPHIINSSNLTSLEMALINGKDHVGAILSIHMNSQLQKSPTFTYNPCAVTNKSSYEALSRLHGARPQLQISPNLASFQFPPANKSPYELQSRTRTYCTNDTLLHPCTSISGSPHMRPQSPQIFKFPPSPICSCTSPNASPLISTCYPTTPTSPYYMSHNLISPNISSPIVPPWMFAYGQYYQRVEPKLTVKKPKSTVKGVRHFQSWWKKLRRRCKKKSLKKTIKVYVTFDEESQAPSNSQLENLLCSLNLDFLIPLMKSHEIDMETFQHLQEKDLEELGIVDKALRFSIMQKITSFKNGI